jgi:hypothetical protein
MRVIATLVLTALLALPAGAAVVHDESVNGDLSSDPATPTALNFAIGSNTIIGTCGNVGTPPDIRDYITFAIEPGENLTHLNLLAYAPDNLGFCAFNSGVTSFIPSAATDLNFLCGIHPSGEHVGQNLMPLFVTESVTQNSLSEPVLPPGNYCFLIQQTSPLTTFYTLEFGVDRPVPATGETWGAIKRLYR